MVLSVCFFPLLANKDVYANVSVQGHGSVSILSEDSVQIMALDPLPKKKQDVYDPMLRWDCAAYISQVLPM